MIKRKSEGKVMQIVVQMEEQEEEVKGCRKRGRVIEESKPYILCIFSNVCFAGYNIVSKVALDKGMSRYVLVVYGHAFGTLATALLAFLFESFLVFIFLGILGVKIESNFRNCVIISADIFIITNNSEKNLLTFLACVSHRRKNESKINVPILRNVFFLGLLGGVLGRTLFYMGLEYTSPTFASAMAHGEHDSIYYLHISCVVQDGEVRNFKAWYPSKDWGNSCCLAGATLMTLYKGIAVITTHTESSHQTAATSKSSTDTDWIKGSLVLAVSFCSSAAFYILQTSTIKMYPAPITLTTSLTCLSGTLLSTIMAALLDHKASSWKLSWNTLLAPMYSVSTLVTRLQLSGLCFIF